MMPWDVNLSFWQGFKDGMYDRLKYLNLNLYRIKYRFT